MSLIAEFAALLAVILTALVIATTITVLVVIVPAAVTAIAIFVSVAILIPGAAPPEWNTAAEWLQDQKNALVLRELVYRRCIANATEFGDGTIADCHISMGRRFQIDLFGRCLAEDCEDR
jgi:hypothetical protein